MAKTLDPSKLEPIGDCVIVKRDKAGTKTKGGIMLPDGAAEEYHPNVGTVLAVGPGARRFSQAYGDDDKPSDHYQMQCTVGDRVFLDNRTAVRLFLVAGEEDSEVIMCSESQGGILAIIR
jgi:co-chaperonin GroES (HSP10)